MLLESAALMFLLHPVVAFALHFYMNSQLLCIVLFCLGFVSFFHSAGCSFLKVGWQVEFNWFMTVVVNEVKNVFLMLCCHFHSCIFVFM